MSRINVLSLLSFLQLYCYLSFILFQVCLILDPNFHENPTSYNIVSFHSDCSVRASFLVDIPLSNREHKHKGGIVLDIMIFYALPL